MRRNCSVPRTVHILYAFETQQVSTSVQAVWSLHGICMTYTLRKLCANRASSNVFHFLWILPFDSISTRLHNTNNLFIWSAESSLNFESSIHGCFFPRSCGDIVKVLNIFISYRRALHLRCSCLRFGELPSFANVFNAGLVVVAHIESQPWISNEGFSHAFVFTQFFSSAISFSFLPQNMEFSIHL